MATAVPAAEARRILSQAWETRTGRVPSWRALRLALAQSHFEGVWGAWNGWNNWGAVQSRFKPPCPEGTAQSTDSYPTANGQVKYEVCFIVYPTLAAGAEDFVHHLKELRPLSGAAIETGDVHAYAVALYREHYYGGFGATDEERIASYEKALRIHLGILDRALGLADPGTVKPAKPAAVKRKRSPVAAVLGAVALGIGLVAKAA